MNKKGITMIELLAVICVIAILLLVGLPLMVGIVKEAQSPSEPTKEEKLDGCMKEFNNFEYCKYKVEELG